VFGFGAKQKRAESKAPPPTTGDRLVYAMGDIHGRLDLMDALLQKIAEDTEASAPEQNPVLVFLGDYVDRGPGSRGVIERLLKLSIQPDLELRTLKGNHEQAMLAFLDDPDFGPAWLQNGGAATLASYGVASPQTRIQVEGWELAREKFAEALPPEHLQFLRGLELYAEYGDYVFVHAGLRPGVPIARQTEQDLLWIRYEFLEERRPFEKVVVHGHTPEPEPFLGPIRLGLDTGAYATGVLTAARLCGPERAILQARSDIGGAWTG
jgi:serine/threonine protein phosphatase 1